MYITTNQSVSKCILLLKIPRNAMITVFFYRSYELVIHNTIHLSEREKCICRKPASEMNTTGYALEIIIFIGGRMFLDTFRLVT